MSAHIFSPQTQALRDKEPASDVPVDIMASWKVATLERAKKDVRHSYQCKNTE